MGHTGRPTMLHTKLKDAPSRESDARGPWSHEQLEWMNDRFAARLQRAIKRGDERRQSDEAYSARSPSNRRGCVRQTWRVTIP